MVLGNAVNASQTGFQSLNAATGVWNGRSLTPGAGISITNQDGTGGNPVITATGMVPDPFGTVYIVDDFIQTGTASEVVGDTNWGLTGSATFFSGTAGHPGILQLGTGGIMKTSTTNQAPILLGNGEVTIEMLIRITNTSAAEMYLGLSFGTVNAEPTDGCYFFYASGTNSGNWVGKTAQSSTRSSANSNIAMTPNVWTRLKIVVNAAGTSVGFFINGTEITNSPLTTNIPLVNPVAPRIYNSNASGVNLQVDLVTFLMVLTTPR